MVKKVLLLITLMLCMTAGAFSSTTTISADSTYTVTIDYNKSAIDDYLPDNVLNKINNYTLEISPGETIELPSISQTLKCYYKCEWLVDGTVVNVSTYSINHNTTFVARWTPIKYTIYYNYLSGEQDEISNLEMSKEFTIEDGKIYYYRPQREGYSFVDWYTDPAFNDGALVLFKGQYNIGTVNLYARWQPIEYQINYNTDAYNVDNPPSYNLYTGGFDLADPKKEGYIFRGWYLDKDFTTKCDRIDSTITGNINLYPKWEAKVYSVTYIMPDGSKQVIDAEYGSCADLPRMNKSIFEIAVTDLSRKNITGDTTINIKYINIWYVYVLALLLVAGITVSIVFTIIKRKKRMHKLRYIYNSNSKHNRRWR